MCAVVLDAKPDARHHRSEGNREYQSLPPGGRPKNQQYVRNKKPGENGRALHVHPNTISPPPMRVVEELINSSPQHG